MSHNLTESTTLAEAATDAGSGVLEVLFLTPGWGSSGYYSPEVVEAAAPLFAKGTHLYFDHPTAQEQQDRPVRSVRDMAAVIVEEGTLDKSTGGIRGKVKPFAPYRDLLLDETFASSIGLSIRAAASDITVGEAEGRSGNIIGPLEHVTSVDFVTRAGRGGKVLQVLEAAAPNVNGRAVDRGVEEATVDERRQQLNTVLGETYGGRGRYVYVRDFDDTTVWFEAYDDATETSKTWEQSYTTDGETAVTLTGEREEKRPVTRYVSTTRSDSTTTTTTEESEEDTIMGNISIEESEHRRLTEAAGRVDALEQERDTERQRREVAEAELAKVRRTDAARRIVAERAKEAEVTFTPLEERGLLADLPTTQEGALDEAAFTTAVDESAALVKRDRGAGQVSGFGSFTNTGEGDEQIAESDIDNAVAGAFGRTVKGA